jgi:hypothetical protein
MCNWARWLFAAEATRKGLTAEGCLPTVLKAAEATSPLMKENQGGISQSPRQIVMISEY